MAGEAFLVERRAGGEKAEQAETREAVRTVALLPLAEAIERIDPRLRERMTELLRADFREVVRWEAPVSEEVREAVSSPLDVEVGEEESES
jgi:ABC-type thiamine transport system ATPase subunit